MKGKKYVAYAVILAGVIAGGSYIAFYQQQLQGPIYDYIEQRDHDFIAREFKENWYLLISSPDYDIEHMLSHRAPNKREQKFLGKMAIKVLYEKDEFVGFTTYYMRTDYQGDILFLDVAKKFRGRGYGTKLINYALGQLKNKGAVVVKLVTRVENITAQKLYIRLGFEEYNRSQTFVFYRKYL